MPTDLEASDEQKLHCFLERILKRRCLSITTLTTPEWFRFYSPDKEKFALFEGGWLIVAQNSPNIETLPCNISKIYPQIEIVDVVPDYYIGAIYERLLYTELSAREIYIDLVRKKMMERLKIGSDEALKVMQNQTFDWRKLLFLSEQNARSMIYSEYVENSFIESDEHFAAHKATNDLVKRSGWDEIKREDVEAKRAEVKAELKNYSFKDKVSYFANIKANEHGRETYIKLGVLATAMSVAHGVSPEAGMAVGLAAAAYVGAKVAAKEYSTPETPKQLFSTADYADLKHTQMALRKLSRKLEKKEINDMIRAAMAKGVLYPMGR